MYYPLPCCSPDIILYGNSYVKRLLEQRDKHSDLNDQEFNQQPGSLFTAGVDTTSATLQSLILALVLNPEVQRKAHEEMDQVVGESRSPTWDDEARLPYLQVDSRFMKSFLSLISFYYVNEGDRKGNGV